MPRQPKKLSVPEQLKKDNISLSQSIKNLISDSNLDKVSFQDFALNFGIQTSEDAIKILEDPEMQPRVVQYGHQKSRFSNFYGSNGKGYILGGARSTGNANLM